MRPSRQFGDCLTGLRFRLSLLCLRQFVHYCSSVLLIRHVKRSNSNNKLYSFPYMYAIFTGNKRTRTHARTSERHVQSTTAPRTTLSGTSIRHHWQYRISCVFGIIFWAKMCMSISCVCVFFLVFVFVYSALIVCVLCTSCAYHYNIH